MDGSSSFMRSGAGLLFFGSKKLIAEYALRFDFSATNNKAKYEALVTGLRIVKELRVQKLRIHTDSQLVAGQIKRDYEV